VSETVPPGGGRAGERRTILADLLSLTKPRVISLLLVTAVAPMYMTEAGVPSLALVGWVLLGGYLMAGGANAINMWFDEDIDDKMSRTKLRAIPAGRLTARQALVFGVALAATAFALFWTRVNELSAWLAFGGLLFYVFIYTIWLKRTSTQNIVIGGAAGAFPPLVGWAAVTNRLDLTAIYLFVIIFFWTPPHFWALALLKRNDYARAGVPMLPVIRGERRTKWEMLVYALLLLPITLLPFAFGAFGRLYLVAAALLGARLLWYCVKLLKETRMQGTEWKMYRYSLLYLALLFVAMAVDRRLLPRPVTTPAPPAESVLILDQPLPPGAPLPGMPRGGQTGHD
jgi:protoheme IX farnesyltransferase